MHRELNKLILQIIIPYTCIGIIYQIDFKLMEKSFKGLARENKIKWNENLQWKRWLGEFSSTFT